LMLSVDSADIICLICHLTSNIARRKDYEA
jgi:hypothetical protein